MSKWTLIDCLPMVADQDDLPRTLVGSEEELRAELNRYRLRQPASIVELVSPGGETLQIGLGGSLSGMRWLQGSGDPANRQLRMSLADRTYSDHGVEFRYQGSDTGFRPKHLIPAEKAIDAAVEYFQTGKLPAWLKWAEWNQKSHRLEAADGGTNGIPPTLSSRPQVQES
jgi:Immunity protein Imm1